MNQITVDNVSMVFGGIHALQNVSFAIEEGKILGLIGPNGAGKTTLFNCLTGVYTPTDGSIALTNEEGTQRLNDKNVQQITNLGIARTFQNIRLFENQSVIDNVVVAMNQNIHYSLFSSIFKTKTFKDEEAKVYHQSMELLKLVDLDNQAYALAKSIPYGQKRRLEIVRAMATGARYIFLDEPAAGMNESETLELKAFIKKMHEQFKLTIILIEHDMGLVMDVCDSILVLDYGKTLAHDTPLNIRNNPQVIKAYLGEDIYAETE